MLHTIRISLFFKCSELIVLSLLNNQENYYSRFITGPGKHDLSQVYCHKFFLKKYIPRIGAKRK
jgi:hypothetical protein